MFSDYIESKTKLEYWAMKKHFFRLKSINKAKDIASNTSNKNKNIVEFSLDPFRQSILEQFVQKRHFRSFNQRWKASKLSFF